MIPGVPKNSSTYSGTFSSTTVPQKPVIPSGTTTPSQTYIPGVQNTPSASSSLVSSATVPQKPVTPATTPPSPIYVPGVQNIPSTSSSLVSSPIIPQQPVITAPTPQKPSTIPNSGYTTRPLRTPVSQSQPVKPAAVATRSTPQTQYSQQSIDDANAVVRGLVVARHEGQIKPRTQTWRRTQDAIALLRRGRTRQEAATRAKVPVSLLTQLIEWGQNQDLQAQAVKPVSVATRSTPQTQYSQQSIDDANAVVRGLVVARREGQIKPRTQTWRRTQDAIALLRRGRTRQEAATRAKVPVSLLTQLIEWGQNQSTIAADLPVQPVKTTSIAARSTRQIQYSQQSIDDANAVVRGLVVARHNGHIKPGTQTWRKTQDAVILLRQGKTRQEAAKRANLPVSVLTQLIEWGQNKPNSANIQSL